MGADFPGHSTCEVIGWWREVPAVILTGRVMVYAVDAETVVSTVAKRHALTMLHRGVATVHTRRTDRRLGPYEDPASIALIREIDLAIFQATGQVPYSRRALFIRDRGRCGYCGRPGDTMDHIVPKSRGGPATWTNAVVACRACNARKADRTPEEAGMPLLRAPFAPTFLDIYDPKGELT